jgi:hypothetical protein
MRDLDDYFKPRAHISRPYSADSIRSRLAELEACVISRDKYEICLTSHYDTGYFTRLKHSFANRSSSASGECCLTKASAQARFKTITRDCRLSSSQSGYTNTNIFLLQLNTVIDTDKNSPLAETKYRSPQA